MINNLFREKQYHYSIEKQVYLLAKVLTVVRWQSLKTRDACKRHEPCKSPAKS